MTRATAFCELVKPVTTKAVGVEPVGAVVVVEVVEAVEAETVGVGDWACRFWSQTFAGNTRARSRRTCSHVIRCEVTVVTALRRAATWISR